MKPEPFPTQSRVKPDSFHPIRHRLRVKPGSPVLDMPPARSVKLHPMLHPESFDSQLHVKSDSFLAIRHCLFDTQPHVKSDSFLTVRHCRWHRHHGNCQFWILHDRSVSGRKTSPKTSPRLSEPGFEADSPHCCTKSGTMLTDPAVQRSRNPLSTSTFDRLGIGVRISKVRRTSFGGGIAVGCFGLHRLPSRIGQIPPFP